MSTAVLKLLVRSAAIRGALDQLRRDTDPLRQASQGLLDLLRDHPDLLVQFREVHRSGRAAGRTDEALIEAKPTDLLLRLSAALRACRGDLRRVNQILNRSHVGPSVAKPRSRKSTRSSGVARRQKGRSR